MVSDISGKELNLSWDERYQLESVKLEGTSEKEVNYQYNVLGQRVARSEVSAGVTNTEYYVHSGVNIIADLDENKELLRYYSYAPGYDNIISMTTYSDSDTNTYFYIRNHNNSVVALIDEEGAIAESYEYTSYGKVTAFDSNGNELEESAIGNRYTFQGREIDWSTGLYNFRARWYDAETGRWLSKDPIGINGGLNQYVFCGNNPVMFLDPEGNACGVPIAVDENGRATYGPERDWGSNFYDPVLGYTSGGKGLSPTPVSFTLQASKFGGLGAGTGGNWNVGSFTSGSTDGEFINGSYDTKGGGFFAGASFGAGYDFTFSFNDSPEDIRGTTLAIGGSYGFFTAEINIPLDTYPPSGDGTSEPFYTFGILFGWGSEVHVFINETTIEKD